MSKMSLKILEDFFKTAKLNNDPIILDEATTIIDQKKFVESHLALMKTNSSDKIKKPYGSRLVQFYEILNQK